MNWYIDMWKQALDFKGRSRRKAYWTAVIINSIISSILSAIGAQVSILGIISTVYSLAALIPTIALAIRRMHDVGKSGWFCLIPIYNLILCFTEGEAEENAYGPNPKEEVENIQ